MARTWPGRYATTDSRPRSESSHEAPLGLTGCDATTAAAWAVYCGAAIRTAARGGSDTAAQSATANHIGRSGVTEDVAIHVNVPPRAATAQAPHSTSTSTAQRDRPCQSDRTIQNTMRQV
eukprot:scaffold24260_cov126-Isochrysis_galbana.AAC.8